MSSRRLNTAKRKDGGSSDPPESPLKADKIEDDDADDALDYDEQDISWLEGELEKVNLELTTVRNERDKQRQQLSTLETENDQLTHQKEQRVKRSQLQNQLQDVEKSIRKKTNKKLRAVEDLEQSKSRHRQLGKTLELLEKGVQSILAKSYYYDQKDNKTEEGNLRTQKRQEVLKQLLADKEELKMKLLTSSVATFGFGDASRSHRNKNKSADEDDEINDGEEDRPMISLFADKNKRMDSINSEVSQNDYLEQAAQVYRVPSAAAEAMNNNNNRSSRSRSRSRKAAGRSSSAGRDRSNSRDRSTRSNKSNSNRNKSQSGRRGGKRPNKNNKGEEDGDETINHSTSANTKTDLESMLESNYSDDDASDDTPKTANTNG